MNHHMREETINHIFEQALLRIKHRKATLPQIVDSARVRLSLVHAMEAACLNGPRVLGRLAPSQEALNRFIYPHLPFQKQFEMYPEYTMAVR
jgi:hypothetical protein